MSMYKTNLSGHKSGGLTRKKGGQGRQANKADGLVNRCPHFLLLPLTVITRQDNEGP